MFFKAHYGFEDWMRDKSPKNRNSLTLNLALRIIEAFWREKTKESNILVFVGIDEYQKLGQEKLIHLLDSLCNSLKRPSGSHLSFFCMLAGTDLNMTHIARTSHPNTQRTPIRFLNNMESIQAIGPFIAKKHPRFVLNEVFAQNVFYLGGVPRLLTSFADKVTCLDEADLCGNQLRVARMSVLSRLQYPQLSLSDTLKLLAISFTNKPISNVQERPFLSSSQSSARGLTWSQMIANGICQVQDDGQVTVPFHLVPQVLTRQEMESDNLNQSELALLSSLKCLSLDIEFSSAIVPSWLSWEAFGANFYCIRINSFLVLDLSVIPLYYLLRGCKFNSTEFEFSHRVHLKVAKVFPSNERYGPDLPRTITRKNASFISVDWVEGENLQIVLNGDNGAGVDIFFILKREDCSGYDILLDQRKRLGSEVTHSNISSFISKVPGFPKVLSDFNVYPFYGLMSVYSEIKIDPVPEYTFFVSLNDSLYFHATLFDHPGCSIAIDVNSALKSSIAQIFQGDIQERMKLAKWIISKRKIKDYDHLLSLIKTQNGKLKESAVTRIKFK
ncbi:hypothetical protein BC833DRAFT_613454 [Globomyces pollinis-pini]|nr:hypothetical protein BC833DRAFT_613454 [Globomyces pollinis-pini]